MGRSKSGCWTCRLQTKKKCDERKPTCRRCADCRVHCLGYGPRPRQDELRMSRKVRIARVTALGTTVVEEDSGFRVWRPESTHRAKEASFASSPRPDAGTTSELHALELLQYSAVTAQDHASNLAALDRVNSDMLNFLHPQLLRNYTDRVFWLDSRFYQSPGPSAGNSWLGAFLCQSEQSRLAAALMGLTWHMFETDPSSLTNIRFTRPLMTLHALVVSGVRDQIERSKQLFKTEKLAFAANLAKSATLLLVFEVWRTLQGDWMAHLQGMNDILRWAIDNIPEAIDTAVSLRAEEPSERDIDPVSMTGSLTSTQSLNLYAMKWFIQSFVWNDITAAVWIGPQWTQTRSHHFYLPLLERGVLQLDRFMGCEDSVLYLISQISILETKLIYSLNDGGPKQNDCEMALNLNRALRSDLQQALTCRRAFGPGMKRDAIFVTEMWIYAALVYLHVVTAGPSVRDSALRCLVARAALAYEEMPRRLDIHIAMPFSVLACMANEPEVQTFLAIAESTRTFKEMNPGQRKTLQIVRECHRLRRLEESSIATGGITWRDGATSLGLSVHPV